MFRIFLGNLDVEWLYFMLKVFLKVKESKANKFEIHDIFVKIQQYLIIMSVSMEVLLY